MEEGANGHDESSGGRSVVRNEKVGSGVMQVAEMEGEGDGEGDGVARPREKSCKSGE